MGAMARKIHREIIEVAKNRGCIYDSDLADIASLSEHLPEDRGLIFVILDNISRFEYLAGRPLLTAVVIGESTDMPGVGFFDLAKRLGEYDGNGHEIYWRKELRSVHNYWARRG